MPPTDQEQPGPQQAKGARSDHGKSGPLHKLGYPFRQVWRGFQYVDGAYLRGHPELELFPTEEQRRHALRSVVHRFVWRRAFWWAAAKAAVFAVLLVLLGSALLSALRTRYPLPTRTIVSWAAVPCVLVIGVTTFFANRWLSRSIPKLLRHELLDCGVPICVACGYPLLGLSGPNCPECGSPFDERVRQILEAHGEADTGNTRQAGRGRTPQ
jgi:hypothetical protein